MNNNERKLITWEGSPTKHDVFLSRKKWKDWASRRRGKEDESEGWDEGGRGRKKTKVGKKEGVKEKGKGHWINEIWQQEWNKFSIKVNDQVCQMDEKMFLNAINRKIQSSIDGWNVTTSNNHKNVIDYIMKWITWLNFDNMDKNWATRTKLIKNMKLTCR